VIKDLYFSYVLVLHEMGGVLSTCGREESCIQGFGEETWGSDHLEDPGIHERIILKERGAWTRLRSFRIGTGGGLL
jgi:hypothetical protein